MYNTKSETRKFHTDSPEDMKDYDDILNDPLCSIIAERKEKLNTTEFDERGKPSSSSDEVILVVTWETKSLA